PAAREKYTGRLVLNVTTPLSWETIAEAFTVRPPLVMRFWPVPVSEIVWGEPPEESTIEMAALSFPTMEGVNETVSVQAAPDGTIVPHVLDKPKSVAFAPVTPMLV